jgi:hypothetical protein
MLKPAILLSLAFLSPSLAKAEVWPTSRGWSAAAETSFGNWIANVPNNIFTNPSSPYAGISTDCADAAYALRIIYAYENNLPVAFSGPGLSNSSSAFDATPAGIPRLKKFINHVSANTSTMSLARDTYPIAINRRSLRAGTLFLHSASGANVPITYRAGHVYYIQGVHENGMIQFTSSTVPAMVRDLQPRIDIVFAPFEKSGGYRAWRAPGMGTPGLSEEQFGLADWRPNAYRDGDLWQAWTNAVRERLSLRPASSDEELGAAIQNVSGYIKERVKLVQKSWSLYRSRYGGQGCMRPNDYDDYSTPTRDVKIQSELEALRAAAVRAYGERGVRAFFARYKFQVLPEGTQVDLNQIWNTFETETVLAVSEPEHSPAVRWGLERQDRWPCPHRAKQYVGGENAGQD